jgi:hypothetical protein
MKTTRATPLGLSSSDTSPAIRVRRCACGDVWDRPSQIYFSGNNKRIFAARYAVQGISAGLSLDHHANPFSAEVTWRFPTDASITTSFDIDASFTYSYLLLKAAYSNGMGVLRYRVGVTYESQEWEKATRATEKETRIQYFGEMRVAL